MESRDGFPFRFSCKRSGNCCSVPGGVVRVSAEDVHRIAAHLGLDEVAVGARYLRADGETLRDGDGTRCIFLDDGHETSCSIYSVRPEKCRSWPFWPELLASEEMLAAAIRRCPGIECDEHAGS